MSWISGPRPTTTFDLTASEHLLDRGPFDGLPDAERRLGELLAAAARAATPEELEGATAAAAAFLTGRAAVGHGLRRTRTVAASVFTALVLAVSTGTAVAAKRGTLPDPMQQVAHEALAVVGIPVPSITDGKVSPDPGSSDDGVNEPPAPPAGQTEAPPAEVRSDRAPGPSSDASTSPTPETVGDSQTGSTVPRDEPTQQDAAPVELGGDPAGTPDQPSTAEKSPEATTPAPTGSAKTKASDQYPHAGPHFRFGDLPKGFTKG